MGRKYLGRWGMRYEILIFQHVSYRQSTWHAIEMRECFAFAFRKRHLSSQLSLHCSTLPVPKLSKRLCKHCITTGIIDCSTFKGNILLTVKFSRPSGLLLIPRWQSQDLQYVWHNTIKPPTALTSRTYTQSDRKNGLIRAIFIEEKPRVQKTLVDLYPDSAKRDELLHFLVEQLEG